MQNRFKQSSIRSVCSRLKEEASGMTNFRRVLEIQSKRRIPCGFAKQNIHPFLRHLSHSKRIGWKRLRLHHAASRFEHPSFDVFTCKEFDVCFGSSRIEVRIKCGNCANQATSLRI